LLVLIKGCDWFVEAAACIAKHFQISEIIIGLTLVSIGTSLPELATDIYASATQQGDIALGDIVGSNITNICLILGLGIVLTGSIKISKILLTRDVFIMLLVFLLFPGLCYFGGDNMSLSRFDGLILLIIFISYLFYLFRNRDSLKEELPEEDTQTAEPHFSSLSKASLFLFIGIILVFLGAKLMVDNVAWTADKFDMPKALVAATVVAFGTSLPELAVTVTGVFKKKNAIALGNVIGSCIFNLVMVMGIATLINPIPVNRDILYVILPIMVGAGLMMTLFMRTGWRLIRLEGVFLLLLYIAFIAYNVLKIYQVI